MPRYQSSDCGILNPEESLPGSAEWVESAVCFPRIADCPIEVAAVTLRPDKAGRRRWASGRGRTSGEALRGALAEAAERASAVHRGDEPSRRASFAELAGQAVDPRSLLLISERQYRERRRWNRSVGEDHRIPARFDPGRPIEWLAAKLQPDGERYVPAAHCLLGYPGSVAQGFPLPDSSGLAAGDTQEQAAVGAFLELVERDAVAIWWYGRARRPELAVPSAAASLVEDFSTWLGRCGRRLHLLDLTHDFAVPVVAAIASDSEGRDLSFGFAAAGSVAPALESALGELVQFDTSKELRAAARGGHPSSKPDFVDWCSTASLADNPHLVAAHLPSPAHIDQAMSIEQCAALCRERGLELLTVDLTRPDIGVPVARVAVPGLRPLWPRFAPGRLFDIPIRMGWVGPDFAERDTNPVPIIY
jgi:ribosomal protein S12 methylthiotransferase accessory factor